jgi:hypothetical protein
MVDSENVAKVLTQKYNELKEEKPQQTGGKFFNLFKKGQ